MSSILQEALAVFASRTSLHVCARKKNSKTCRRKTGRGFTSPPSCQTMLYSTGCIINPQRPSMGRQIVCNTNRTGTYIYICSLFCSARLTGRIGTTVRLAQPETWSVHLPRTDGTQPKQNSPGWSLAGCATSLLTGQTVAIPSRYNGEWAEDTELGTLAGEHARPLMAWHSLASDCYWRPIGHEMMGSLQFLVGKCQHHYHSEHPS